MGDAASRLAGGCWAVMAFACVTANVDREPGGPQGDFPPDFYTLPLLDLQWVAESANTGFLNGALPNGEAFSARVMMREYDAVAGGPETGHVDRGAEEGAEVFSPFPERWAASGNNVLNPSRSYLVDVRMVGIEGRTLECRFELQDRDRGFEGGATGLCRDLDENRYRAEVRR